MAMRRLRSSLVADTQVAPVNDTTVVASSSRQ